MCIDMCRMAKVATKQVKSIAEIDTSMVQVVREREQDIHSKGYVKKQEQWQVNCNYCGKRRLQERDNSTGIS